MAFGLPPTRFERASQNWHAHYVLFPTVIQFEWGGRERCTRTFVERRFSRSQGRWLYRRPQGAASSS